MSNFQFEKSKQANIIKSIRFPEELNKQINDIVARANQNKDKKEYSFNGLVVSACEYAIKNLNQ